MKLLLDQNLSDKIPSKIQDLYPETTHVKWLQLERAGDQQIWDFAAQNGFVIVSKDSDFYQRSLVLGHPPKFVYMQFGNCRTGEIVTALRENFSVLQEFDADELSSVLVLRRSSG